jgi:hypothetical protein
MNQKPKCEDFIVGAIRYMRQQPPNIIPPTAYAGTQLYEVFKTALSVYSEKVVEKAFDRLIAKKIVLAVIHAEEAANALVPMKKLLSKTADSVKRGDRGWPLDEEAWKLDEQSKVHVSRSEESFRKRNWQHFPKLYIVADGVPLSVLEAVKRGETQKPKPEKKVYKSKAQLVIESMQGK